jgi:hypothetical protein
LFFPSISPEAGEPNNEVIPSKELKYQLKSQILSEIKNEREIYFTNRIGHNIDCFNYKPYIWFTSAAFKM